MTSDQRQIEFESLKNQGESIIVHLFINDHALGKYALAFIDIPPTIQFVPQKHVVSILKDEYENRQHRWRFEDERAYPIDLVFPNGYRVDFLSLMLGCTLQAKARIIVIPVEQLKKSLLLCHLPLKVTNLVNSPPETF